MYDPKGNGKDKAVQQVRFIEIEPPAALRNIVHRFLELKTETPLAEDYRFHALPDACTYIVFDQLDRRIAGVTKLRATSEEFNLGRNFHFINIRFLPGVWQQDPVDVAHGRIDTAYAGDLPLAETNEALSAVEFSDSLPILGALAETLIAQKVVAPNPVTQTIFRHLDDIHTVADMAELCALSPRQLQRVLKRSTGFAPHDFLKVLRLQQSLNGTDTWSYADQSHFIHSFRNATGYTPGKYARKFDV